MSEFTPGNLLSEPLSCTLKLIVSTNLKICYLWTTPAYPDSHCVIEGQLFIGGYVLCSQDIGTDDLEQSDT